MMSTLARTANLVRLLGSAELPHPQYLIFFVTSQCPGRCRHCFYWESLNQPEDRLSYDEIAKIAGSMGPLLQVTFTGGEPFLREDFEDIVELFHRHNRVYHLGIATSGFLPERTVAGVERILERCPGANLTVGLPLEGPPALNDDIRGREGFYQRTAQTLAGLKQLKSRWPRLTTLLDITASGFNRGRLQETYAFARDQLQPDAINLILTRGNPREPAAALLDPKEVAGLHALMEDDARAGRVSGYSFFSSLLHAKDIILRRMALDIYQGKTLELPCQAGRVAGVLMPEGRGNTSELWHEPLGNLRGFDYCFPALWKSEAARRARRQILATRCSCFHQCFLSNTIFFNLRSWPALIREWIKII
jgi:MoaA/NifB/PqqE/SkfB family radical SAM enzyme